jgi:pimeloyl-ACP methyl ester carboxylesterase
MPKKQKPAIIFIHGFRGSHYGLLSVASYFEDDYDIFVPDIPGSGTAKELDNKTLDGYAEWLHNYILNHGLKKPYVVGHSMGSMIVSHFVKKYPDDVAQKVVLMSPVFRSKFNEKKMAAFYKAARGGLAILNKKQQYKLLSSRQLTYIISHLFTYDKKQQKRIDELHYQYSGHFSSADSFIADMRLSMRNQTIIPEGKETLLCFGKHDQLTPYKYTEKVAEKYGATAKRIDNAGHLLNYETPEVAAKIIRNFIES